MVGRLPFSFNLSVLQLLVVSVLVLTCGIKTVSGGCGYESCPKPKEGYLNIHLVAHSHDDVGWLKTVDQYYYGDRNPIQLAAVQYILDSVVSELQKSPDRRFIYVETGFFWRWWTNQNEETQNVVRKLINSGQLEFISGGWCMNDEAASHYQAIIDQMTLGLRYLNDTFGECALPKIGWQIDPFGHSREQASLFAGFGFDGLFFGRLDYQDKVNRKFTKNMETIWNASPKNLGSDSWLFTGVLFNGYNPPDGFCFDIFCGDDPINDDPKLLGYNLDEKVEDFIQAAKYWSIPYRTQNVLMTMGSDFQYMAAYSWYKNLDKLIKHVNERQKNGSLINVFYSTPSCYLQEVNRANLTWSTKTDDFFPYASDPHAFWTGYFTSRPTLKYFIHKSNNFLQGCKQLSAMTDQNGETLQDVFLMEEPVAVNQHHDAVSGTAQQHVTDDYSLRLNIGLKACERVISSALRILEKESLSNASTWNVNGVLHSGQEEEGDADKRPRSSSISYEYGDSTEQVVNYTFCHQLNISVCEASELSSSFQVSVYNPLSRPVLDSYISLPVSSPNWRVEGPNGLISAQTVPLPTSIYEIPGRVSSAHFQLVFPASALQGLTATNFRLTKVSTPISLPIPQSKSSQWMSNHVGDRDDADFTLTNSIGLSITFDGKTGLIKRIGRRDSEMKLEQNFFYYKGMRGNNSGFDNRASGAYIFRPNGSLPIPVSRVANYSLHRGKHVQEVRQVFCEWVTQVIRLYDRAQAVEFEWLVGPIPISDKIGKEIITVFSTDLETGGTFYTDSNGREILRRERNKRETWKYKIYEPVAGNYYPVNSRMIISDGGTLREDKRTLIVLNDRSQGGSSNNDGELEFMVHRRLLDDDAFGVAEALNERAFGKGLVAIGKHWVVFAGEQTGVPTSIHRPLAQEIFLDRILAFRSLPSSSNNALVSQTTNWQTIHARLTSVLPPNVQLLTLSKLSTQEFLVRFEHIYEKDESADFSNTVDISIQELQQILGFKTLRETTLGGNQWKDEAQRLVWRAQEFNNASNAARFPGLQYNNNNGGESTLNPVKITFSPFQIRTFVVTL